MGQQVQFMVFLANYPDLILIGAVKLYSGLHLSPAVHIWSAYS